MNTVAKDPTKIRRNGETIPKTFSCSVWKTGIYNLMAQRPKRGINVRAFMVYLFFSLLIQGCATSGDLEKIRTEVNLESQTRLQKIEKVATDLRAMEAKLQDLSASQASGLAEVQKNLESRMTVFDERLDGLTQVRQEVESVRKDVALLKSLGTALDSVQERLKSSDAAISQLKTEAKDRGMTLNKIGGDVQKLGMLEANLTRETNRLRIVMGDFRQGVIKGLRTELDLAKGRVQQLQQILDQFPGSEQHEPNKAHVSLPSEKMPE